MGAEVSLSEKTGRPMTVQFIVFDLFHTLVDPEDFRPKDFRRVERIASLLQIDPDAFSSYWESTVALRNTRSKPVITYIQEYTSKIGKTCSSELLSQIDYELGCYQDMAILKPRLEAVSGLKSLTDHGFRLGLLTNCDERDVRQWKRSPLSPFFEAACFSCVIGFQKPDRDSYRIVLEKLGTLASQGAYVGDGGSNELEGARKAGFGRVVFMRGFVSHNGLRNATELETFQRSSDISIDSLQELPRVLEISESNPNS